MVVGLRGREWPVVGRGPRSRCRSGPTLGCVCRARNGGARGCRRGRIGRRTYLGVFLDPAVIDAVSAVHAQAHATARPAATIPSRRSGGPPRGDARYGWGFHGRPHRWSTSYRQCGQRRTGAGQQSASGARFSSTGSVSPAGRFATCWWTACPSEHVLGGHRFEPGEVRGRAVLLLEQRQLGGHRLPSRPARSPLAVGSPAAGEAGLRVPRTRVMT